MKQQKQLYGQNEIAKILGISRGTFSKWLKENSVSPKQRKGQQKLYDKTVVEQYRKSKESHHNHASSNRLTTVHLLQNSLNDKQREIDYLRQQLKDKDEQLKNKDQIISDFGSRFAKLADQAQQLNLTDKDLDKVKQLRDSAETSNESSATAKKAQNHSNDSRIKKHWWKFWK